MELESEKEAGLVRPVRVKSPAHPSSSIGAVARREGKDNKGSGGSQVFLGITNGIY